MSMKRMKPEQVKIIQFITEPYKYFESNGGPYKDEREGRYFFGLGDDGNIYQWVTDYRFTMKYQDKFTGWKLVTQKETQ